MKRCFPVLYSLLDRNRFFFGIVLFIFSGLFSVMATVLTKVAFVQYHIDVLSVMLMRYFFAFILCFPLFFYSRFSFSSSFFSPESGMSITRDIFSSSGAIMWYYYCTSVPVNNSTLISFLIPSVVVFFCFFIPGFRVSLLTIVTTVIGFIGVLISVGFSIDGFSFVYIPLLVVVLFRSFVNLLTRKISSGTQSMVDMLVSNATISLFVSLFVYLLFIRSLPDIDLATLIFAFLLSLTYIFYYVCFMISLRFCDVSFVQPFDYLRIVFSAVLSFIFLSEVPSYSFYFGTGVIAVGVVILTYFGSLRNRKKGISLL